MRSLRTTSSWKVTCLDVRMFCRMPFIYRCWLMNTSDRSSGISRCAQCPCHSFVHGTGRSQTFQLCLFFFANIQQYASKRMVKLMEPFKKKKLVYWRLDKIDWLESMFVRGLGMINEGPGCENEGRTQRLCEKELNVNESEWKRTWR